MPPDSGMLEWAQEGRDLGRSESPVVQLPDLAPDAVVFQAMARQARFAVQRLLDGMDGKRVAPGRGRSYATAARGVGAGSGSTIASTSRTGDMAGRWPRRRSWLQTT